MSDFQLDPELRKFASSRQLEYIDAIEVHGGAEAAARALGVSGGTVRNAINSLRKRAAVRGHSPEHDMTRTVPDPYVVKGVSTYYDRDGKPRGQWVKSSLDREAFLMVVRALTEDIEPVLPVPASDIGAGEDLLNCYVLTDAHLGMLAWHEEGGANWNLKIAEQTIERCFELMVERTPSAETALIGQLGDWMHFDGLIPETNGNGHVLDADTRFAKVIRASVRLLRKLVHRALETHSRVILLLAEGNHDESSSQWLQTMFEALYEAEPRVQVVVSAKPYYAVEHGQTSLFFHHGHKRTGKDLAALLAAEFRAIWGRTTKSYGHTGHRHHELEQALPGIKIVQHPTLAARDAHASRSGFLSERQASAITYCRNFGEVGRVVVTPEMVNVES